jgi:hypothetical protein
MACLKKQVSIPKPSTWEPLARPLSRSLECPRLPRKPFTVVCVRNLCTCFRPTAPDGTLLFRSVPSSAQVRYSKDCFVPKTSGFCMPPNPPHTAIPHRGYGGEVSQKLGQYVRYESGKPPGPFLRNKLHLPLLI